MITFTELGYNGRLGNQLWQYALLKSVSLRTGKKIVLPISIFQNVWHSQKCLMGNFNLRCDFSDHVNFKYSYYETSARIYDPSVYEISDDTNFFGFFQNCRYLDGIRDELMIDFGLKIDIVEKVNQILEPFRKKYKKIVSVHFRRGDQTSPTQITEDYYGENGEMTKECELGKYIDAATSRFYEEETLYYVISGGSHNGDNSDDIEWCKRNFIRKNVIYSHGIDDIVEFCLLTKVDANICAHASSFGWWGAYLNPNQEVIAPKNALITSEVEISEYYPSNWIII